jgi:general L-amino acid transport system permease protein
MIIPPLVNWFILDANFVGSKKADCGGDGACWIFIQEKLKMFTYGFYPEHVVWRANLTMGLTALSIFLLVKESVSQKL